MLGRDVVDAGDVVLVIEYNGRRGIDTYIW